MNHWNARYIKCGLQIFVGATVCIFSFDDSVKFMFVFMPDFDVVSNDGANISSSLASLSDDQDIVTKLVRRIEKPGKQ